MKIVFLNVWDDAKRLEEMQGFLREHATDTDVFCFQESGERMLALGGDILASYESSGFAKMVLPFPYCQSIYVRKDWEICSSKIFFDGPDAIDCGFGLAVELRRQDKKLWVANIHGISYPGKLDTPGRLKQSREVIEFYRDKEGAKIIGGDFNVLPETESVRMFKDHGYHDLIEEYEIKTTRNHFAWDHHPDNPLYYSDYVFTSPEVRVRNFTVIENEISDHLPMIVEIEE
jgi:hypothetical protein